MLRSVQWRITCPFCELGNDTLLETVFSFADNLFSGFKEPSKIFFIYFFSYSRSIEGLDIVFCAQNLFFHLKITLSS